MTSKWGTRLLLAAAVVFALVLIGEATRVLAQTTQSCGNEGEAPCPLFGTAPRCDTALTGSLPRVCGCLLRGFFGNCILPRLCITCENSTRRLSVINGFTSSWVGWALANQRELSQDEPLNWVTHLGTHNSFNSDMDGHAGVVLPNQHFTMTDQLRSGARLLTLDLQPVDDNARLCHAFRPDGISLALCEIPNLAGVTAGMRFYANGIKEIANWMSLNRREIVFINTEDYVGTPYLLDPLEAYLGDKLLPSPLTAPPGFTNTRWPTRREMLAGPSRAIAFTKSGQHTPLTFGESNVVGGFSDNWYATNLKRYPGCPAVDTFSAAADTDRFRGESARSEI